MGFIEETGAAQHYRDARILPIYEGTNGIQALDLLSRKLLRDEGAAMTQLILELRAGLPPADAAVEIAALRAPLAAAIECLDRATAWLLDEGARKITHGAAGATPYLALCGSVLGGWLLAKSAALAAEQKSPLQAAKAKTARFYAENLLGETTGLAGAVIRGAESTLAFRDEEL
jgi:hypothetical protein